MKHILPYIIVLSVALAALAAIYLPFIHSPWHGVTHGWEGVFVVLAQLGLALVSLPAALVLTFAKPRSGFKWPLWLVGIALLLTALPMTKAATDMKDRTHFIGTPREEV